MTVSSLTSYHDVDTPIVCAWNSHMALVLLSPFCITLVPLADAEHGGEPEEGLRKMVREFLETPAVATLELSLGRLSAWANRRGSKRLRFSCETCGWAEYIGRREEDRQNVLGAVFNRRVIRETLQWLYETDQDAASRVELRLVPTPPQDTDPLKLRVLVMRCGEWTAVVMCCRPDSGHGEDALC